jgi:hypothetical protein
LIVDLGEAVILFMERTAAHLFSLQARGWRAESFSAPPWALKPREDMSETMETAQFFSFLPGITKITRYLMSWNILTIILLLFSGCIQGYTTLLEPSISYPPSANLEILTEKPTRPYRPIAVVRAVGQPSSDEGELLAVLRKKAKSVGADAILVLSKEEDDSAEICAGGIVAGGAEKIPVLKALAIKYN